MTSFNPDGSTSKTCTANDELERILHGVSKKARRIFESMRTSDIAVSKSAHNIFLTNNILIGEPIEDDPVIGGIYATASRLNHCCVSNTSARHDESCGKLHVVAVERIEKDEQIVSCFGPWAPTPKAERRHELLKKYGMLCRCKFCNIQTCGRYEPMNSLFATLRFVLDIW